MWYVLTYVYIVKHANQAWPNIYLSCEDTENLLSSFKLYHMLLLMIVTNIKNKFVELLHVAGVLYPFTNLSQNPYLSTKFLGENCLCHYEK